MRGRLLDILAMVQAYPHAGRPTSRVGVLRVSVMPHPYIIDYRVMDDEVVIQRFRHTARRPLP